MNTDVYKRQRFLFYTVDDECSTEYFVATVFGVDLCEDVYKRQVKDTSLANTIANKEIIMMAKEYSAKGLIWPLFSTALFFLVFVGALTLLFNWAEDVYKRQHLH